MRLDERERPSCVKEAEVSSSLPFMRKAEIVFLRIGVRSGAQVLRNIAGIPSGHFGLEVSSWGRVWQTFRVEY